MIERSTVNSLLRCAQAYCNQLCDKETLEFGIVYYCERFPDVPALNQFREVIAEDAGEVQSAVRESADWFEKHRLTCHAWAPALGRASEALAARLRELGYERRVQQAWRLASWPDGTDTPAVRVLPARAMRAVYTSILGQVHSGDGAGQTEAALERLDDPSLDVFVGLVDKTPVGTCALYQVGDLVEVRDLWVAPDHADRDVATALLSHVLALAKRLTMANVLAAVGETDVAVCDWLRRAGFVADGEIETFCHRSAKTNER